VNTLTATEFHQKIERGQIEPLYLFCGPIPDARRKYADDEPEEYLQRQAVRALIEKCLDPAARDFNLSVCSAVDSTLAEIVDAARQLPVFSNRRLVIVRDLDKAFRVKANQDENESKKATEHPGVEELIEYLKDPNSTTTVVFLYDKPDRRLNLTTALLKTCTVVEFKRLTEKEAEEWVKDYLRQRSCFAENATIGLLVGRVGADLTLLVNELDKLVTYVKQGPIARTDVETLVPHMKEHSNFELSDYILARDRTRALKLLRRQLDVGEEPVMLVGLIGNLYRRMLLAKDMMAQGLPNSEVAKAIGMSPYAVGKFNEQVRRVPTEDILYGIQRIAEVDRAIKSSLGPPELQLEILVCELCASLIVGSQR
jgi:DNA polymerase-3 subunit delta